MLPPNLRPVIAITCGTETFTDRRGVRVPRHFLNAAYVRAVANSGGLPVVLPPLSPDMAEAALRGLEGLVVSGGANDVPPAYYHEEPHRLLGAVDPERSDFELALLRTALAAKLPVLAVCGGMQLLNVTRGGSLYQDRSLRPDSQMHEQPFDSRQPFHDVELTANSRLARVLGVTRTSVNSTHHQLVHELGQGLQVAARTGDGVIEAIEASGDAFVVGVQWHPENLATPEQLAIYSALVEAAGATRKLRSA
jgi:putative glutamine amidotransferase